MGLIDPGGVAHPTGVSEAHKGGRETAQTLRLGPRRHTAVYVRVAPDSAVLCPPPGLTGRFSGAMRARRGHQGAQPLREAPSLARPLELSSEETDAHSGQHLGTIPSRTSRSSTRSCTSSSTPLRARSVTSRPALPPCKDLATRRVASSGLVRAPETGGSVTWHVELGVSHGLTTRHT